MNETIYDDGKITVTPTEIRAKGFVLYADNVSSITVKTVRPAKGLAVSMAFPIVIGAGMYLFLNRAFGSLIGQQSLQMSMLPLILLVPICFIVVLGFLLRVSQLFLQTSGGPVMLASKVSLTNPHDTVRRYERIKAAIEKAKSLRKKQTFQPA